MAPTSNSSVAAPRARAPRLDSVCAQAVELARESVTEVAPEYVGAHQGAYAEADRVVTHQFDCGLPGYRGWRWAVTVTRIPRSRRVTVSETVLLPGPDALRPPEWVPWQERLEPGDLGVGDVLPTAPDDERLVPGYVQSDDPAVEEVAWELGLGRPRVLSREGRLEAAQRWYEGDHGPSASIAAGAPAGARCGGCGFYLPLAGALRQMFGVCGNLYAPDDGQVVSADHGCGAHSEVMQGYPSDSQASPELPTGPVVELSTVYDDTEVEPISS